MLKENVKQFKSQVGSSKKYCLQIAQENINTSNNELWLNVLRRMLETAKTTVVETWLKRHRENQNRWWDERVQNKIIEKKDYKR